MKILVLGSKGQLGRELVQKASISGIRLRGTDIPQLDITNFKQVRDIISDFKPSIVVNTAAYTDVDRAENDIKTAFSVNRDGPAHIAKACKEDNIPLVHISTDYVFNGKKRTPYVESDPITPLGVYGQSKAEGESKVKEYLDKHIILRTSWLYGFHGHNFVKTILKIASQKESIQVVSDQHGSPTSAADLAGAVLSVCGSIQKDQFMKWGIYHYCGKSTTTRYGFAKEISRLSRPFGKNKLKRIEPVTSEEYPALIKRPLYLVLDCSLIQKTFNIKQMPWQSSLKTTIDQLLS